MFNVILDFTVAKKQIEINHRTYRKKLRSIETIGLIRFLELLYTIMYSLSSVSIILAPERVTHTVIIHTYMHLG